MGNIEETVGERIRRLRKKGGWTIEGLATAGGISPQTIKDLEAERTEIGVKSLVSLAKVYRVSMEYILFGGDDVEPASAPIKILPSKFIRMYLKVPDDVVLRAQGHELSGKVWELVRIAFDEVEAHQEQKQKLAQKAKKSPA